MLKKNEYKINQRDYKKIKENLDNILINNVDKVSEENIIKNYTNGVLDEKAWKKIGIIWGSNLYC